MAAEPADAQVDKLIGEVLASRYKIERRLGEGAMGAVYRARHVKVGRPFAVKVLHAKLLEDKKTALRFEREAELAGRLRHPNVIGVVDVGETPDGLRYMVMDFAAGDDLATVLAEAPMPPQRIINLTRQMLEGLYHAHEAGLIHRDFKPENVIVEKDDHGVEVPRIVDFGIAILREGGDSTDGTGRLTTNGLVLGTPHYMAPEQAVADPIDHRIDLFALGIVMYEMLCGKLPFDGSGAEVARANMLLDPPPIAQRVPYLEVDPLLEAFARRLLQKKRDARPATAKAARELLDLIDHDRAAAAAALGVPVATASRAPAITQPVSPPRPHSFTEPPPVRAGAAPALGPAHLEAPPIIRVPVAVPGAGSPLYATANPPASERAISTALAKPLPFGRGPGLRRWLVIGALAGAAAITAIAIGASGGASDERTRPNPPTGDKIVMQVERSTSEPSAPPTTGPAPPPTAGVAAEPRTDSTEATEPRAEPPRGRATPDRARIAKRHPTGARRDPDGAPEPRPTSSPGNNPELASRIDRTKPDLAPPDRPKHDPSERDPAAAMTKTTLGDLYKVVGGELAALTSKLGKDATGDLWQTFRYLRVDSAMRGTPGEIESAYAGLVKLRKTIAARGAP